MSYQMKCWGPGEGRHICHQHPSQEGGEVTTWSGQHTMCSLKVERGGSQSQIYRDQDVGLRFEDALVNAVYQQEAAWTEKFYLMHLYGIRNWERETSFFPISIHTMWIGKLSLWSLRSPPSAQPKQPIPGTRNWLNGTKKSVSDYRICIHFSPHTRLARESFHKIGLGTVFPLLGSGSVCLLSVFLCTLPRSKSWQRPKESSVNNGTQPLPI